MSAGIQQSVPSRAYILNLYHSLLRASRSFSNYNFRDYAYRRIRDSFHQHKNETGPTKIIELVKNAEKELEVIKRQGYLNNLYAVDKLVVEEEINEKKATRFRGDN
ncbi:hypothetical protein Glove_303g152 [Diversispora epigaea]|uniref:Complex 1 LYR protein domain-containing protein n=1 Tax=Diversispora epigaea TaxID=1348612 RepID=A0A397HYD0_9GLOM|nr:hypothetical protein Glove_303g152 [Diversispora epigaea]